jgi:hypothetical protein
MRGNHGRGDGKLESKVQEVSRTSYSNAHVTAEAKANHIVEHEKCQIDGGANDGRFEGGIIQTTRNMPKSGDELGRTIKGGVLRANWQDNQSNMILGWQWCEHEERLAQEVQ